MGAELRDKACIVGIGETQYCLGSAKGELELGLEAALLAINDARLKPQDIDGIVLPGGELTAADYAMNFGIEDLVYTVSLREFGGAMCIASVEAAALAVASGLCRNVLIPWAVRLHSERQATRTAQAAMAGTPQAMTYRDYYAPYGMTGIHQFYAWHCRRHMTEFGTNERQLGAVAVASRKHARLHAGALLKGQPLTMEDYLHSPWMTYPYRVADCMIETDGSGAVVLTSAERARDTPNRPVYVMGVGAGSPYPANDITNFKDFFSMGSTFSARRAFAMAGITPGDLDFAQIYDMFTYHVIAHLEEIGICKRGEGGPFVEDGRIELGGELPVNTHGGNLAHATCQSMNHLIEAVCQLRGQADKRQIRDAEIGVVVGLGGGAHGAVAILRR
ncbi:MAG: transporter [Candidatus Binatia bacterium]